MEGVVIEVDPEDFVPLGDRRCELVRAILLNH